MQEVDVAAEVISDQLCIFRDPNIFDKWVLHELNKNQEFIVLKWQSSQTSHNNNDPLLTEL